MERTGSHSFCIVQRVCHLLAYICEVCSPNLGQGIGCPDRVFFLSITQFLVTFKKAATAFVFNL